jgi:quercetin dioxygenase-like cupin family protein
LNSKSKSGFIRGPLLAGALTVVFAGTVLATPANLFVGTLTSRATLGGDIHFNTGAVKFQTKGAVDFITATVNIAAGGSSGWHSHPGVVLVSVTTGSITLYDANCVGTVYPAGSAFVESGDAQGLVRNENATVAASVMATYLVEAGTPNSALRVDAANPGCPQS